MVASIVKNVILWYAKTPERALDQAYRAALKIKDIEDKHFNGQKVAIEYTNYGASVVSAFRAEVNGFLQIIKIRKAEYETSRFLGILINLVNVRSGVRDSEAELKSINADLLMFEKLKLVDEMLSKYRARDNYTDQYNSLSRVDPAQKNTQIRKQANGQKGRALFDFMENTADYQDMNRMQAVSDKSGVLPRSFFNTIDRIKQEIDPKVEDSEEAVLQQFRSSRYKTAVSIKLLLLLIIVPLLAHQLSKTFVINPILDRYFETHERIVFLNSDYEEEAFVELRQYGEALDFRAMIGQTPKLSQPEKEERVKEKAMEITEAYRFRGSNAIANVFADLCSLLGFALVIIFSRREIAIAKSFLDERLYNLSDSAKAFMIILFTDIFVGFHSPHGWEVILENVSRHFGLPENRDFNFMFIATFPVILDTVLKYWIFRYLNRISPSAVATYRNMNE